MEKTKIDFPEIELVEIKLNNKQKYHIRPYLTRVEQIQLINNYLSRYFSPETEAELGVYDISHAEQECKLAIINTVTDIEIIDDQGNFLMDENVLDGLIYLVWDDVRDSIRNYGSFRALLQDYLVDLKDNISMQNSFKYVANDLLAQLKEVVNKFLEFDASPEAIERLRLVGKELVGNIENSQMGQLFKEANQAEVEKVAEKVNNINGSKRGRKPKSKSTGTGS